MKDLKERVEALKIEMTGKVGEKYLQRAEQPGIEGNNLPTSGRFGKVYASGNIDEKGNDYRHLRLSVVDERGKEIPGKSISLSNVKATAFIGKGEVKDSDFGIISKEGALKGKLFLKGQTINPAFAGLSVLETAALLEDNQFTTTKKSGRILKFKADGYSSFEEAKDEIVVKDFYEITIEE